MYTLVWVHPLLWGEWELKKKGESICYISSHVRHSLLGVANRELSGQHQHNKRTSSCCFADRVLSVWVCSECCSGHQVTIHNHHDFSPLHIIHQVQYSTASTPFKLQRTQAGQRPGNIRMRCADLCTPTTQHSPSLVPRPSHSAGVACSMKSQWRGPGSISHVLPVTNAGWECPRNKAITSQD